MIRKTAYTDRHDNMERWLLTYADMITLLTAFFIMMYAMSVMSRGKFSALATSVRSGFSGVLTGSNAVMNGSGRTAQSAKSPDAYHESMRNLRQYVEQNKLKGLVNTRADARGIVISLVSDNMLFERGQAKLNPQFAGILAHVGEVLKTVPNDVEIEGHTCDIPIHTAQFPSNWELSAGRSAAVLREMTDRYGLSAARFRASGYAETRPLVPNSSEENRIKNRRVDIVILKTEQQHEGERLRKAEIERITAAAPDNGGKPQPADSGPVLEP